MAKHIEEQSPWVNEESNIASDSLYESNIGEIGYNDYQIASNKKTIKNPISSSQLWDPSTTTKIPSSSVWKEFLKFLAFLLLIIGIVFFIAYLFNKNAPTTNYRWIIKKTDINKLNSKDYITEDIDDEYYEINTTNKDIINNSAVEKDSFFELQAAPINNLPTNSCSWADDWDKKALWDNEFVDDYIQNSKKITKVAIIDTWINTNLIDFKDNIDTKNSINIVEPKESIDDKNWHWTNIALIIHRYVSTTNFVIIKANSKDSKKISYIDTIKSINYAIKQKPDVINISFGWDIKKIKPLQNSISRANSIWIIIVVSWWNSNSDKINHFPTAYSWVITTWSFNDKNSISEFSNKTSDFNFPGECISTANNEFVNGNSYSAPILSATILMIKMFIPAGTWNIYYSDLMKSNSNNIGWLLILSIPKLLNISDDSDEYIKNLEWIKKDINKTSLFLDDFKESITIDSSLDWYEKALNTFKSQFNKTQNDILTKLSRLKKIFNKKWITLKNDDLIIAEINNDLAVVRAFLEWDKVILDITWEKKLAQTLWVDSCIENTKNIKCWEGSGSISNKCMNKFAWWKNLVCWVLVPIIKAWTQLPAVWSWKYVTILNDQVNLPISIIEWESFISRDNKQIWKVILEKLPRKSAWEAWWNVNFMIDSAWTLSVKVIDINDNNNEVQSRIEKLLSTESSNQINWDLLKNTEKINEIQNILELSLIKLN